MLVMSFVMFENDLNYLNSFCRKKRYLIKDSISKISNQVKLLIGETHASAQRANHRNIFMVKKIKIHPKYRDLYNDISLIKVEPEMDFDKPLVHNGNYIQPICLPTSQQTENLDR